MTTPLSLPTAHECSWPGGDILVGAAGGIRLAGPVVTPADDGAESAEGARVAVAGGDGGELAGRGYGPSVGHSPRVGVGAPAGDGPVGMQTHECLSPAVTALNTPYGASVAACPSLPQQMMAP